MNLRTRQKSPRNLTKKATFDLRVVSIPIHNGPMRKKKLSMDLLFIILYLTSVINKHYSNRFI